MVLVSSLFLIIFALIFQKNGSGGGNRKEPIIIPGNYRETILIFRGIIDSTSQQVGQFLLKNTVLGATGV